MSKNNLDNYDNTKYKLFKNGGIQMKARKLGKIAVLVAASAALVTTILNDKKTKSSSITLGNNEEKQDEINVEENEQ